jgi:DNA-directed RNA polymerase specialized sigma24 family protein
MTSDNDLILRAQGGDMAAFEELVFRHDRQVLSIAARYTLTADDALSPRQRTVFTLRHFEQLSLKEIAGTGPRSRSTASGRL